MKKIIKEQQAKCPEGYDKVNEVKYHLAKSQNKEVKDLGNGVFCVKKTQTNITSQLPSWAQGCIRKKFTETNLEVSDNKVIGYVPNKTDSEKKIYTFNENRSLSFKNSNGKLYSGFWKCEGDKVKLTTCEDSEILSWDETSGNYTWKKDETESKNMGCSTTPPTTFSWDTNCGDNDLYKKGCKDGQIRELQKCLNKSKKTTLPDLITDGKWGKKTQSKIEELFPDYKNGITQEQIDTVCDTISNESEEPENSKIIDTETSQGATNPETTITPKQSLTKIRRIGMKNENKKTIKRLKEQVEIVGDEPDEQASVNFFKMAVQNNCLPTWFAYNRDKNGFPLVYVDEDRKYKDPFIFGKISTGDTEYAFFQNFKAINNSTGVEQTWKCPALSSYLYRPEKSELFDKFGIDYTLGGEKLKRALDRVTYKLNFLIQRGVVSDDIMEWKNLIDTKYPNANKIVLPQDKSDVYLPDKNTLELEYKPAMDLSGQGWKNVIIHEPIGKGTLTTAGVRKGEDAERCKQYLVTYLQYAITYAARVSTQKLPNLVEFQNYIRSCSNSGLYKGLVLTQKEVLDPSSYGNMKKTPFDKWGREFEWKDIVEFLKGEKNDEPFDGTRLKLPNPYAVTLEENKIREKIKSTLVEMVERKQKSTIQENLIRNRVGMLFENTTFKSRKQRREFVIDLLKEALIIESQAINKKVLKEEFWDVVKGFFGNESTDSLFMSFKTKMAEWLISHLSPKKADGWIANCIKKTIQDIDMRDVEKITDCDFLTKQISHSIIQKLDEKMSNEQLKDEGIYDIVRGGMSDNVKSSRFTEHVENKVKDMICPVLKDMSNRFDSTFDEMKKRAVGL